MLSGAIRLHGLSALARHTGSTDPLPREPCVTPLLTMRRSCPAALPIPTCPARRCDSKTVAAAACSLPAQRCTRAKNRPQSASASRSGSATTRGRALARRPDLPSPEPEPGHSGGHSGCSSHKQVYASGAEKGSSGRGASERLSPARRPSVGPRRAVYSGVKSSFTLVQSSGRPCRKAWARLELCSTRTALAPQVSHLPSAGALPVDSKPPELHSELYKGSHDSRTLAKIRIASNGASGRSTE